MITDMKIKIQSLHRTALDLMVKQIRKTKRCEKTKKKYIFQEGEAPGRK